MPNNLFKRLRRYFLTGLIVTIPLGLTCFLVYFLVNLVDTAVEWILPVGYSPHELLGFRIPGAGLIFIMMVITLVGLLARNFLGRQVVHSADLLMAKMPLLSTLYGASKQLLETLLSEKGKSFKRVVWVEFPTANSWALGFVTGEVESNAMSAIAPDNLLAVYVPTTPVPTSGFLLYVKADAAISANLSVEDGLKLVVSGGIVTAPMAISL